MAKFKTATCSFRAELTADEYERVQNYLNSMRQVGRVTIAKSEAVAAVFLAAINSPEISDKIRAYIQASFKG